MKLRLGISESISHWAKYDPNKICLVNETTSLSFLELNSIVDYIAENFFLTSTQSTRIPLSLNSKLLLLCSIIASLRCNKVPVLLNPNLTSSDLKLVLKDLVATNIFIEKGYTINAPCDIKAIEIDDSILKKGRSYKTSLYWPTPNIQDDWGVLYSSGTTGRPKGIVRSHFSILSELLGWCFELETRRSSHYYIARPIYYTGGLVLSLTCLLVGGKVSVYDEFSPERYLEHLSSIDPVDLSFLIPSQISSLVTHIKQANISDFASAKVILSMGAPFPQELKREATGVLKSAIIESWGNTEGLGTITNMEDLELRPSSIGRPFLTDDLFIIDENLSRVATNVIGRLAGNVDSRFSSYSNREDLNQKLIVDDVIVSEDLGMQDENGYFYLFGRVTDVINTKNGNVYPILLEKQVSLLSEVEEAAILGISDGDFQIPVCVIKLRSSIEDTDFLLDHINATLSQSGLDKIFQLKIVTDFPKTASGKIIKSQLKLLFTKESIP